MTLKQVQDEYDRLIKLGLVEPPPKGWLTVERAKPPLTKSGKPDRRCTRWKNRVNVLALPGMIRELQVIAAVVETSLK